MTMAMPKYRYALDGGIVVDVFELTDVSAPRGKRFTCLGCSRSMIARFRGSKRQPFFAHDGGVELQCSSETYLHRLAKLKFVEVFTKCKHDGESFTLEIPSTRICSRFQQYFGQPCELAEETTCIDIAKYHDTATVEKGVHGFVADVLLESNRANVPHVLVEFAVTHRCEEEKVEAAGRIVEVSIQSEADVTRFVDERCFSPKSAGFFGFRITPREASECVCASDGAFLFRVFDTGKSILRKGAMLALLAELEKTKASTTWSRFVCRSESLWEAEVYRDLVHEAAELGVPIRNCYLCRYAGENHVFVEGKPVFCKWKKVPVETNIAADCEAFRRPRKDG